MSTTPPPTYSQEPNPLASSAADLKPAQAQIGLETVAKDLSKAINDAKGEKLGVPKFKGLKDIESPVAVNVFNYTGAVFSEGEEYEHSDFLPSFPKLTYPPLEEFEFVDRGLSAHPEKARLYDEIAQQGGSISFINPAIGAEIKGISLKKLSDGAKDDLALLIAERGVVAVRDQHDLTVEDQLALGRHWGPLHVHATTGVPQKEGLEEIHVVYADQATLPDRTAFASSELYHSDVTYEIQPPSYTGLKLLTAPSCGGDTLFSSGAAVYAGLSPGFQKYLEGLEAMHSGFEQAKGARSSGQHVRREPIETAHPVVRVHPVTGIKSVFVNPGFTRRIIGVSKSESDNTLKFLYSLFTSVPEYTARVKWEVNDLVLWDNRSVNHSATFDFWPERRHAIRVTPHGERPLSVEAYEAKYGKEATDIETVRFAKLGIKKPVLGAGKHKKDRGFKD